MAIKIGRKAKVVLGTYTVAEQSTWAMSGLTNETLDKSVFEDEIRTYEFGIGDYGTITFSGFYDPTDTTGQVLLRSAALNKSKIQDLKLYIDATSYWTAKTTSVTGEILVTKVDSVTMENNGIGRIDFEAKVSGELVLV